MPTPFTHLRVAACLLADADLPADVLAALRAERGAFLLGNIAADARVASGVSREDTHFYAYDQPLAEQPWRRMLRRYPLLADARNPAQRAFLAGYVAHLAMDEIWSLEMVRPYFALREWAARDERFLMLNLLLIWQDERDYHRLEDWQREALLAAMPDNWLPFMPDDALAAWRDFVAAQLPPQGASQTLTVIGERVGLPPEVLHARVHSRETMETGLWAHVPREVVAGVEQTMYARARADLLRFWRGPDGGEMA